MRTRQQHLREQSLLQPLFELAEPYRGPMTEPFARQLEVVDNLVGRSGADDGSGQRHCPEEDYGGDIDIDLAFLSDDDDDGEEG